MQNKGSVPHPWRYLAISTSRRIQEAYFQIAHDIHLPNNHLLAIYAITPSSLKAITPLLLERVLKSYVQFISHDQICGTYIDFFSVLPND